MVDFDDNAGLDSSQIEDRRGSRGRGVAVGGGGLGLIGLILALLFGRHRRRRVRLGPRRLNDSTVGQETAQVQQECRTGDANRREDCGCWRSSTASGVLEDRVPASDVGTRPRRPSCSRARRRAGAVRVRQTGPFYCPADQKVYLDSGSSAPSDRFRRGRLRGLRGGHEYGHHVQNQLGVSTRCSVIAAPVADAAVRSNCRADAASAWAANAWRDAGFASPADSPKRWTRPPRWATIASDGPGGRSESWTHGSSASRQVVPPRSPDRYSQVQHIPGQPRADPAQRVDRPGV